MLEIELSVSHRRDVNEFPKFFSFHNFQNIAQTHLFLFSWNKYGSCMNTYWNKGLKVVVYDQYSCFGFKGSQFENWFSEMFRPLPQPFKTDGVTSFLPRCPRSLGRNNKSVLVSHKAPYNECSWHPVCDTQKAGTIETERTIINKSIICTRMIKPTSVLLGI